MKKLIIILIISLIFISGCKTYTGNTIDNSFSNSLDLTINSIQKKENINFYNSEQGNIYLIVDFTITNPQDISFNFNPFLVKITDEDGYSYGHDVSSYELPKTFESIKISPKESASGKLAYIIPKDSKGLRFVIESYNKNILSRQTLE